MTAQSTLRNGLQIVQDLLQQEVQALHNPELIDFFLDYYQQLVRWNKTIKLTGVRTIEEFTHRHLIDSLVAVALLEDLEEGATILDIGSGAGFPGMPLALVYPQYHWYLIESRQRRSAFLSHLKSRFKLASMEIKTARVAGDPELEDLPTQAHRLLFRAVNPVEILPIIDRYLVPGGECLYWASSHTELSLPSFVEEMEAIQYQLPSGENFQLQRFVRK